MERRTTQGMDDDSTTHTPTPPKGRRHALSAAAPSFLIVSSLKTHAPHQSSNAFRQGAGAGLWDVLNLYTSKRNCLDSTPNPMHKTDRTD